MGEGMAGVTEGGEIVDVVGATSIEGENVVEFEVGGGSTVCAAVVVSFEYAGTELLFVAPGWTAAGQRVWAEGVDVAAEVGELTYECTLVGADGSGAEVGFDAGQEVDELDDVDGGLVEPGSRHGGGHDVSLPPFHRALRRRGR